MPKLNAIFRPKFLISNRLLFALSIRNLIDTRLQSTTYPLDRKHLAELINTQCGHKQQQMLPTRVESWEKEGSRAAKRNHLSRWRNLSDNSSRNIVWAKKKKGNLETEKGQQKEVNWMSCEGKLLKSDKPRAKRIWRIVEHLVDGLPFPKRPSAVYRELWNSYAKIMDPQPDSEQ